MILKTRNVPVDLIQELRGSLSALTPSSASHFFGFYDICPWSYDGREIVMLSTPRDFLEHPNGQCAKVVVWNPESDSIREVGETYGWNWQHGARQQWLENGSIVFNDVRADRQCASLVDVTGRMHSFNTSISALHPSGSFGVSANYAKLAKYYSTYGYANAKNPHIGPLQGDDGFWRLDLANGNVDLFLSYEEICDFLKSPFREELFVTHPDFSPSGDKFEFFLIQDNGAGTSLMRLLVADSLTKKLTLVSEEKASHPTWIDNSNLWSWARESSAVRAISRSGILNVPGMGIVARIARKFQGKMRNALLSEGFFIFDLENNNKKTRIGANLLTEDGHYSKHPARQLLIGDTYPDQKGYLTLLMYSLKTGRRLDIARVFHDVRSSLPSLRCDLHPRWSRDGSQVAVDVCLNGVRHLAIFDVTDAIAELDSN